MCAVESVTRGESSSDARASFCSPRMHPAQALLKKPHLQMTLQSATRSCPCELLSKRSQACQPHILYCCGTDAVTGQDDHRLRQNIMDKFIPTECFALGQFSALLHAQAVVALAGLAASACCAFADPAERHAGCWWSEAASSSSTEAAIEGVQRGGTVLAPLPAATDTANELRCTAQCSLQPHAIRT